MFAWLSLCVILLGVLLCYIKPIHSKRVLLLLSLFLFLYKTIEYTLYALHLEPSKIPVEYSTITYFLLSIVVIFQLDSLKPLASFMGIISGLGYVIVFIFLGSSYLKHQGLYITSMAFINHSIVFWGGLILLRTERFQKMDYKKIMVFTMIYLIYVTTLQELVEFKQPYIFILMLLDGNLIERMIPSSNINGFDYLLYFLLLFMVYQIFARFILFINQHVSTKKEMMTHEHTI